MTSETRLPPTGGSPVLARLARLARLAFVWPCLQGDDPGAEQGQGEAQRHQRAVLPGG